MNLPSVTIKDLLEAGVHLGRKTFRWNPKMKPFIFGEKNSVHIIDLSQTLELLNKALLELHRCASSNGKILWFQMFSITQEMKQFTEPLWKYCLYFK